MITKINAFVCECDNCGADFTDENTGYTIFMLESDVKEHASEDGWHTDGDKHYCPECHDFDDDDNLVIKKLVDVNCMVCGKEFKGEEPKYCCTGKDCGCMGQPTEPIVCSNRCYKKLPNHV